MKRKKYKSFCNVLYKEKDMEGSLDMGEMV